MADHRRCYCGSDEFTVGELAETCDFCGRVMESYVPDPFVDIVFDGPPSAESGRFVEVENAQGQSIRFGDWIERPDGYWALRIKTCPQPTTEDVGGCPQYGDEFPCRWCFPGNDLHLDCVKRHKPCHQPTEDTP